jgi:hypothetical protein
MRRVLAIILVISWAALTQAQDQPHSHNRDVAKASASSDAPIKITINPEARVSVVMAGPLPQPAACGSAVDLPVIIINQGFVTAQLEAELVGNAPAGVTVDFHPERLKGVPEEVRKLRVTLTKRGPTDVTIAFRAHNEIPDLGGRDRVHFLIHCR